MIGDCCEFVISVRVHLVSVLVRLSSFLFRIEKSGMEHRDGVWKGGDVDLLACTCVCLSVCVYYIDLIICEAVCLPVLFWRVEPLHKTLTTRPIAITTTIVVDCQAQREDIDPVVIWIRVLPVSHSRGIPHVSRFCSATPTLGITHAYQDT